MIPSTVIDANIVAAKVFIPISIRTSRTFKDDTQNRTTPTGNTLLVMPLQRTYDLFHILNALSALPPRIKANYKETKNGGASKYIK